MARRLPERRYAQGQVLQGALNSLDSLVNSYFNNRLEREYNQMEKRENLLAEVFKQEYNAQMKYQEDLKEYGINLPEESIGVE